MTARSRQSRPAGNGDFARWNLVVPGVSPELALPTADMWFNTAAFRTPAALGFGTATRNSVWGPGLSKADVALERQVEVGAF